MRSDLNLGAKSKLKREPKGLRLNLRLRTRLALVMFLTMTCTSVILMWSYVQQSRQIKAYVAGVTSDLLALSQLSQLTQQQLPPKADRNQALQAYMQKLKDAGLQKVSVAAPTGDVVASTDPSEVGKKIKLKKRRNGEKQERIQLSAEFQEVSVDAAVEQRAYSVQFPIVQGDKVIGYAEVRGLADEAGQLVRHAYLDRFAWTLFSMLAGTFLIVYLAFRFTKPVDTLVTGAQQVAKGNLYVSLPAEGTDEMGRLAGTFNDMVERLRESRKLQERLNEAEKSSLLGRFAATVAHEVRNSLNFINLSIDQIRAKYAVEDARKVRDLERNLGNIKEEVSRLNRLVNEFLSAGRQTPLQLAASEVRTMIEDSVHVVEEQARAQNVEITTVLADDLPEMQIDAAQMKTCFLNILTNAIQAMPRGGEIRVTAMRVAASSSEAVEIRFADTGPGIPPEEREKIFAPYFSTKTTGFGLGLAITRKIVEDHGGRIYVANNTAPGAVMVVELPLPQPVEGSKLSAA